MYGNEIAAHRTEPVIFDPVKVIVRADMAGAKGDDPPPGLARWRSNHHGARHVDHPPCDDRGCGHRRGCRPPPSRSLRCTTWARCRTRSTSCTTSCFDLAEIAGLDAKEMGERLEPVYREIERAFGMEPAH